MKPSRFAAACVLALAALGAYASSHREAPFITEHPKVDGVDFFMFRSYETGREDYVTLIADYQPLQDGYGGPNYFTLDPEAVYEIHLDNDGDGVEDHTFQFRFTNTLKRLTLNIGGVDQEVPVANLGPFGIGDTSLLNVDETYTLTHIAGDRRTGARTPLTRDNGQTGFGKPADFIGRKSIPEYEAYANAFIYDLELPGGHTGRVFVGQRDEPFAVNLGEVFDLINFDPVGDPAGRRDIIDDKNVTSLILELPIAFLTQGDPVLGGWTTASKRQARVLNPQPLPVGEGVPASVQGGAWSQMSRLGSPLVNEVVIGLSHKDRFNASEPKDDAQFGSFVTNPTFPAIVEALTGARAPTLFPRTDLVQVFLTGVPGLTEPANVVPAEMLRLNTSIPVTPPAQQQRLGVLANDLAGFPNGRRPGDDVVDIVVRTAMGALLDAGDAPDGQLPYTDGAFTDASRFDNVFPYLRTPIPGSPAEESEG